MIRKFAQTGKLLDYGCGTGEFLGHMGSRGFNVSGIEPSVNAREQAIRNHGIPVIANFKNLNAQEQFTVITMWHVLEHVHDIRGTLKWLYAALEEEGYLIVAVPNIESVDATHYGSTWAALDVPRHLYHFRQRDIRKLLSQHGFELIQTRRMWFDAPYISMLSEQYRGGVKILSLLKGLLWGTYSNIVSLFSPKNTSSCIYILRKTPI
jgi:2-polyprenyl-3-methyl-5-hydroxy-6-metoxy-1,4-benzoquinol methylase